MLHASKAEEFAAWAVAQGFVREAAKGAYEKLRLRKGGEEPLIFHQRDGTAHLTIQYRKPGQTDAYALVARWLREKRAAEARRRVP